MLDLNNKDWSFDLVPCFRTAEVNGKDFYLIPDGRGAWKKADPRIDKDRVTRINKAHSGNVLDVIRIVKYWNKRATMPSMGSYLLENIILNFYDAKIFVASSYIDIELPSVFLHIRDSIYSAVPDPKGFQADLNDLSLEDREKIWDRANLDYTRAIDARSLEAKSTSGTHKECMEKWAEIFGPEFPDYG